MPKKGTEINYRNGSIVGSSYIMKTNHNNQTKKKNDPPDLALF